MHVYISTKGSHVLNYTWKEEGLLYKKYTYVIYISTPPRSRSGTMVDAKTGSELLERRSRQALGHDVSKLLGRRYM